jgi:hypothetical protein
MPKKKKAKRDIEKGYTTKQMVAKLRRLADCLERVKGSNSRLLVNGFLYLLMLPSTSSMNVVAPWRKWRFSSSGSMND